VVFDTGGISLKPAGGMEDMTMDMGGAGTVAGVMKTLALRKAKANVVGIVGLVENMPDGRAQRPGDIVTSMKGDTVEVINTDAEGRLVLADVMWYAQETIQARGMIDLATLTGASSSRWAMRTRASFPTTTRSATPSSRPRRPRARAPGACRWARPMTSKLKSRSPT
jgi:leucyl aminopeptidase